jgi:integrase
MTAEKNRGAVSPNAPEGKATEQSVAADSSGVKPKSQTKRVQKHLYRVAYRTAKDEWIISHVAIFRDSRGKNRKFRLPADLKTARKMLAELETKYFYGNIDYDAERAEIAEKQRAAQQVAEQQAMTLEKWLCICPTLPEMLTVTKGRHKGQPRRDGTKKLDQNQHSHLTRLLGSKPVCDLNQDDLVTYRDTRLGETILKRSKIGEAAKPTRFPVQPGTVGNELNALKRALDLAKKHGKKYGLQKLPDLDFSLTPSAGSRDRTFVDDEEEQRLFDECKKWPWFLRVVLWANETGMSKADILRMKQSWIDERQGTITVEGGRRKTSTRQICPLTDTCRVILAELRDERKASKVQPINGSFVFTRDPSGNPVTPAMISNCMNRATARAKINVAPDQKKQTWTTQERSEYLAERFTFHQLRKCVAKRWNSENRPSHHALLGLGWSSPKMYLYYTQLKEKDIGVEFGTAKKFTQGLPTDKKAESGGE